MRRLLVIIPASLTPFLLAASVHAQQYCSVGEAKWIAGCEASCTASWEGSDCPRSCTATAPPGFVIVDHSVEVRSVNNGGHDVARIAAGQTFDFKRHVEQAYRNALDVALKANDKTAAGRISDDMNAAISEAESFASSHQLVRLSVNASKHGSFLDRKRGWSNVAVQIQVKCVVPANLEEQLMRRYALK